MTLREIAGEAFFRTRRQIARSIDRAINNPDSVYISNDDLRRRLAGRSVAEVAQKVRERRLPHLTPGLTDLARTAEAVRQSFPDSVEQTIGEAEQILGHKIKVFGCAYDLGPQIDWSADPVTGVAWPFDHFTRVPIIVARGSDVRRVWELNRLHHLTTLGRAYALTGDERFTEEFLIELAFWYEENPPRYGVNWTVAMEPAIRAVNIIGAAEMFAGSPLMTDEAVELILKILLSHGRFIRANIEFSHRITSNHYLSNLIGLYAIAMTTPDLVDSDGWAGFAAAQLLAEMEKQVLSDGVSFEGSTGYHRLVTEIFALFFAMSHAQEIELPTSHWKRLESMFDFTRHYLKPDLTAPAIGDSDDGRLIRFKERDPADHSYLMSLAVVLFEDEKFKTSSRIDEEALWWFGEAGRETFEGLPANDVEVGSRDFPQAQIFIQRATVRAPREGAQVESADEAEHETLIIERAPSREADEEFYAIIDCGDHGARGRGSHAHSDALSVELFAMGQTFLRDPNTFVYTASERWRNRFRSTAYHNTVRIDGVEISEIKEEHLFTLGANVAPQVYKWESDADRDVLDAAHFGYMRLPQPVVHRRVVTLDKREGFWIVEDVFSGDGEHEIEFFFNFDAGLEVAVGDDHRAIATGERAALAVIPVSGHALESKVAMRWVSPAYGTRVRSSGIIYRLIAKVPVENVTLLVPYRTGDEAKIERAIKSF
ncbi:MAG TPA: alginate lyase family protein [Blastocatellia bacterium]|nr:alginate lyase family protein [Blastocatellia bacterium]